MSESTIEAEAKKILGIGTVVIDHVVMLPEYPQQDTKIAVQTQWRQIGGPVPVALSVCEFYGVHTHFSGRWGHDVAGNEIERGLAERGVDLSASQSNPSWSTGFAHVWSEEATGTRTIAFSRGQFPEPTASDLDAHKQAFESCGILHLDGSSAALAVHAANKMRQLGGLVVLDAGSKKPGMQELLPLVDVLVASDLFCRSWFGSSDVELQDLRQLGCKTVMRTHAAEGASCFDGKNTLFTPAVEVNAIDTNGAGDIFAGGVLVGLAKSWSLEKTLTFANQIAGYSCGHRGNSTWPTNAAD